MHFSKSLQGSKSAITIPPYFNSIDFVVVLSYIEIPFFNIFFNRFSPVEKCEVTLHCLYRHSLTLNDIK